MWPVSVDSMRILVCKTSDFRLCHVFNTDEIRFLLDHLPNKKAIWLNADLYRERLRHILTELS